ncbi:MAG: hypothetical protein GY847_27405 [Proteobacteria bacterium]|nr:hypothetical protein [Pseudomonadota bacterium]
MAMYGIETTTISIAVLIVFVCLYLISIYYRNQIKEQLQEKYPEEWKLIQLSASKVKQRFWSKRAKIEDSGLSYLLSNREFLRLNDKELIKKCLAVNALSVISSIVFVLLFVINILFE